MILVSTTFCGCTVGDVVFIAGFVMGKQEGSLLIVKSCSFLWFLFYIMISQVNNVLLCFVKVDQ